MSSFPPVITAVPQMPAAGALEAQPRTRIVGRLWRERLASPAVLLTLVLISVAFFWKVVALHQVLLPADILYAHDPLWRSLAPTGFTTAANPLDSDALTEFYPWSALSAGALHHGVLPLWNPYAFTGTPFLAAMQTAVLYPVNVILGWLLPPAALLGWRAIAHLAIVMVGTFLFARRLRLSHAAALLSALAFGLGLPNVVWLEHPMAGAIAWLPWLLLCVDGLVAQRRARWTLALAAVLAVEILAGHGETTTHALLLCGAYAVFRTFQIRRAGARETGRTVVRLLVALTLGVALAALHLLPVLAQLPLSEAATDRSIAASFGLLGDPAEWKTAVVAVIPDFFGNPTWSQGTLPAGQSYNELALYVGTAPLVLAFLALSVRRTPHVIFFAATALVALGMALRLPLIGLLDNLPVLRLAADGRLRFEYAFAVALLAGYGLDALATDAARAWRWARGWLLVVSVLAALAVVGMVTAPHVRQGAIPLSALRAAVPVIWAALFAAMLWLRGRRLVGPMALSGGALALVVVDLAASGVAYHATVPATSIAVVPAAIRAVQRDHSLYRVAGLGTALLPSLSSLYGLQDIRGYDPAYAAAYERDFAAAFDGAPGMRLTLAPFGPSPGAARMLDLMNVKYLFANCAVPLNERYYRPVFRGSGCVYRNVSALPRVTLVHDVRWAGPVATIRLLRSGTVDPRRTVLLDSASRGARWRLAPSPLHRAETARVTRYTLDDVAVAVRSTGTAALVLTDADAPGWQAAVDGHATPIARADGLFRAVVVGPGAHTVTFTYRPAAVVVGMATSLVAVAIWLLLAGVALITARRHSIVRGAAARA